MLKQLCAGLVVGSLALFGGVAGAADGHNSSHSGARAIRHDQHQVHKDHQSVKHDEQN